MFTRPGQAGQGPGMSARPPSAAVLQTPVAPAAPAPPNWTQSLAQAAVQVQSPFLKIPVAKNSAEYKEIANLFGPGVGINQLDRIINPELWKRFTRARSDLLTLKSEDLGLLRALGLSAEEIAQKTHIALNFDKSHLNGSPYCDNLVLLFHGTRAGPEAVDKILSQGLDERLGSGGTFGRGIYFADDPQKSMQYDSNGVLIVFAVILGDCLAVQGAVGNGVREPEKADNQKRNHQDLFFDSIVGRGTANEYVIFNRALCCPVYTIRYNRTGMGPGARYGIHGATHPLAAMRPVQDFETARRQLPSFAWTFNGGGGPMGRSPFYASQIFQGMGPPTLHTLPRQTGINGSAQAIAGPVPRIAGVGINGGDDLGQLGAAGLGAIGAAAEEDDDSLDLKLVQLAELGFMDAKENERLLRLYGFDLEWTIGCLVEAAAAENTQVSAFGHQMEPDFQAKPAGTRAPSGPLFPSSKAAKVAAVSGHSRTTPSTSASGSRLQSQPRVLATTAAKLKETAKKEEGCPICCVEYPTAGRWETLPCTHKLCTACADRIRTTGTTMSGQTHTFLKCPFCQSTTGIQVGDCPNGTMSVSNVSQVPAGFETQGCGSLAIRYSVQGGGHSLIRTGYLPDNPEGQRILGLLRTAWDRKLIFTIGTSMTTGAQNTLVWNIHHKTALNGGSHGYPDPTYLQRVRQELAQYGIK